MSMLLRIRTECHRLARAGKTATEIAEFLDVHPLTAEAAVRHARNVREREELEAIREQVRGADHER